MFSEVAARLGQFQQLLKTRVILLAPMLTHTNKRQTERYLPEYTV